MVQGQGHKGQGHRGEGHRAQCQTSQGPWSKVVNQGHKVRVKFVGGSFLHHRLAGGATTVLFIR